MDTSSLLSESSIDSTCSTNSLNSTVAMYYATTFPRPYELIWSEQAYISSHIERHTARMRQNTLKMEWADGQISSAECKSIRRMKKLVTALKIRNTRDERSQAQLQTRLAELEAELSWRHILGEDVPYFEPTKLNAESPEFIPRSYEIEPEFVPMPVPEEQETQNREPVVLKTVHGMLDAQETKRWSVPCFKSPWPE